MKKSIKSLISILTVAMMLLAMVPTAMAAPATLNSSATVTAYGEGVSVTEGNAIATVLNNEVFYIKKDKPATGAASVNANLDKVVSFTKTESGLLYTWASATEVKRLDLWMLNCGGIGDYVVEYLDGDTWKEIATGSLDKDDKAPVAVDADAIASYYPIVFSKGVTTTSLRFVIKSFLDEENQTAYISEAKVYNHNNIAYGGYSNYWTSGGDRRYSPYSQGYAASRRGTYAEPTNAAGDNTGAKSWYGYSSGGQVNFIEDETATSKLWYATGFLNSKVKVNKIGIKLDASSGPVRQFEIHIARNNEKVNFNITSNPASPLVDSAHKAAWEHFKTIDCNIQPGTTAYFALPDAVEVSDILIKFTDYDAYQAATETTEAVPGPVLNNVYLYTVPDSEFASEITVANITGTVAAGETVTLNFSRNNITNAAAKVYFAVFSGDELKAAQAVDFPVAGSNNYTQTYTIPSDAGDNLTLKVFIWDGTTLKPLLATPVVVGE